MAPSVRRTADPLLITALLGGCTHADAAKRAGVSEQTARRRLRDPEFRIRLAAAETELIDRTARALADASGEAVTALRVLLRGRSARVRLSAVRAVLEFAPKWRAQHALEERVAALERAETERNGEH